LPAATSLARPGCTASREPVADATITRVSGTARTCRATGGKAARRTVPPEASSSTNVPDVPADVNESSAADRSAFVDAAGARASVALLTYRTGRCTAYAMPAPSTASATTTAAMARPFPFMPPPSGAGRRRS
jgi:hypothetical protein